jgi:hypothetical protein
VATLFVSHKVEDFDALDLVHDAVGAMQRAAGVTNQAGFCSETDPSLVFILHRFPTLEQAHAFVDAYPDLMAAMEKGGVEASSVMTQLYEYA